MTTSDIVGVLQIVNTVLVAVFIAIIVIKFFIGFKRGFFRSLLNGIALVLAIVAGFVTLSLAYKILNPKIMEVIKDAIAETEDIQDLVLLTNSMELLVTVVEGLLGPIIFLVLFFCFKMIFGLVAKILGIVLKIIPIKGNLVTRLAGAGVSILIGVSVFFITLMPFAGYINVAPGCYDALKEAVIEGDDNGVGETINAVCDEGLFMGGAVATVTSPLFKLSTTVQTDDGVSVNSFTELSAALRSLKEMTNLESDSDDIETIALELSDIFEKTDSVLVKSFMVELVSVGGEKWLNNESFLGINLKEEVANAYNVEGSVLDGVLQKFVNVTEDTFVSTIIELSSAVKSIKKLGNLASDVGKINDATSLEDFKTNLADTLKEIDSSTVDILVPAISSDLFSGLSEGESELVAEVLTNTLNSVADMTDEEIDREAEAIGTLLSYASSSDIDRDAEEVIDALISSEIILPSAQTVIDNNEEAEQLLSAVTEEDKQDIGKAIDDYKAKNPDADEEKLAIIKSLFGIE